MSNLDIYVIGLIGMVSGFIGVTVGVFWALKRLKTEIPNILLDTLDEFTPEIPKLMAKPEFQQLFGAIGQLIGAGAKGQFVGGKGGKMKFEDLILGFAANYIMPKAQNITEVSPQTDVSPKW